jgi:hypothetical protein
MTLLTAWGHYDYVVYIMDTTQYDVCSMDSLILRCLHYRPIKPTLFIVYTHQHYVVYRKELLNLRCLNGGFIKLTLLAVSIHQPYVVYIMDPTFLLGLQYGAIKHCLHQRISKLTLHAVCPNPTLSTTR